MISSKQTFVKQRLLKTGHKVSTLDMIERQLKSLKVKVLEDSGHMTNLTVINPSRWANYDAESTVSDGKGGSDSGAISSSDDVDVSQYYEYYSDEIAKHTRGLSSEAKLDKDVVKLIESMFKVIKEQDASVEDLKREMHEDIEKLHAEHKADFAIVQSLNDVNKRIDGIEQKIVNSTKSEYLPSNQKCIQVSDLCS